MKKIIKNQTLDEERALYALKNAEVTGCTFAGPADGESALKECTNVTVKNCGFSLRYPLWHTTGFYIENCEMDGKTRAALWYCKKGEITKSKLHGIKALRECTNVKISDCSVISPEFGWRCKGVNLDICAVESEYFMFESKNLTLNNVRFKGKYSFQYVKNMTVTDCDITTKDAFWHSENVTVKNSVLKGEYLGWYSKNLTLINCVISGTQPLCYCKNLTLINCKMQDCDLSFEYSEVNADLVGEVLSVKNPLSGKIVADGYGEIIFGDSVKPCRAEVLTRPAALKANCG